MRVFSLCALLGTALPALSAVDYATQVEPLLRTRCYGCHGAGSQTSGLRLDQKKAAMAGGYSGAIIIPGNSAESKLITRVIGAEGVMIMPPGGKRMTPE
jgi:mono/diheme cytochrome c family protein